MARLPKNLIRKYGISKKAWSVFRSGKSTTKSRGKTMARRGKRSHGRRSGFGQTNLLWQGVGAGLSGAAEGIANKVSGGALAGNLGAGAVGVALKMWASGVPKQLGNGIVIKVIGDLIEQNIAPRLLGAVGGSSNSGSIAII